MCGIAGLIPFPRGTLTPGLAARMSDRMAHRGPDDHGRLVLADGRIDCRPDREPADGPCELLLLHRRLSILDLSPRGRQPMVTPDGRYAIVCNGEIYNYRELRAELERCGWSFLSRSDTEVLLAALAQWGRAALCRLTGMFAFAFLDVQRRSVLLARDFFGIKPLYYAATGAGLAFASEIKTLLEIPGVSRLAWPEGVYLYLRYGLTDHGGNTMFGGIRQVPPAHVVEISLDDPRPGEPRCYWRPDPDRRIDLSFEDAAASLRRLFLNSVELHLRSDVPVGACLSGGIDSSSIVMAMRRLGGGNLELHAFGYVGGDPAIDEERWIDLAAASAGAHCLKTRPGPRDLVEQLDALIDSQDEPFGSTSIFAQRCVFALVREAGIKVVLDGQGADELLGGYRAYLAARLASLLGAGRWAQAAMLLKRAWRLPGGGGGLGLPLQAVGLLLPRVLRDHLRGLVGQELMPAWLNAAWFSRHGVRPTSLAEGGPGDRLRSALLDTLTRTSLPMLLRYEDRNAMAFSIESRVPFLTPAMAEFCLALPEEYIIDRQAVSKAVFRRAMRGLVPREILDRRDKIGFATPESSWLAALAPWVDGVLAGEAARSVPAIDLAAARAWWTLVRDGRRPLDARLWRWVNLIRWVECRGVSLGD